MNIALILIGIMGVLISTALIITSLERYKRNTVYEACTYLKDLIGVMSVIGLDKDYMDRYEIPDLKNKIKIINTLIDRSNKKMDAFKELNKHVKYLNTANMQKMSQSYELNIDNIRVSLNVMARAVEVYGTSSDKVYELVKRHDRILIITTDGLRMILCNLEDILAEHDGI